MANISERGRKAMRAVEVLTGARNFLSNKNNWKKGDWIKSRRGEPVAACALGALGVAAGAKSRDQIDDASVREKAAFQALADVIRPENAAFHQRYQASSWFVDVFGFNDRGDTSHADVLAAFDLAIEGQCQIVRQEAAQERFEFEPQQKPNTEVKSRLRASTSFTSGPTYDSSLWTGRENG